MKFATDPIQTVRSQKRHRKILSEAHERIASANYALIRELFSDIDNEQRRFLIVLSA